jgi:hypothetical protein
MMDVNYGKSRKQCECRQQKKKKNQRKIGTEKKFHTKASPFRSSPTTITCMLMVFSAGIPSGTAAQLTKGNVDKEFAFLYFLVLLSPSPYMKIHQFAITKARDTQDLCKNQALANKQKNCGRNISFVFPQ